MYNSRIAVFEKFTPQKVVTNEDLSKIVDTSDEWINSRTGISKRCILTENDTSYLASKVAKGLIKKANITADDVDVIIIATITPDYLSPSTACIVQGNIGAKNAFAFDINAACSGFVFALSMGDKYIKSGMYKNVMVIGSETLSKVIDWTDRGTCVVFGDGAGGVLLQATQDKSAIIAEDLQSDGQAWQAITAGKVSLKNPFVKDSEREDFYFKMKGREVFNFATKEVPKSINEVIRKAGMKMQDIKYIVPHQANLRIMEVVAKKLSIPLEKFYLNLENFGNTSSASIPIALAEMVEKNLLQKRDKIIVTGFGGGLTWGSALLEI